MNGEIIQLSYEQMRAMASEILSNGQAIDDLLKRIDSKMVQSLASGEMWNSGASRQFYDIFKQEAAKFPTFLETINKYSEFVNTTVDKYIADDQKLQGEVSSTMEG